MKYAYPAGASVFVDGEEIFADSDGLIDIPDQFAAHFAASHGLKAPEEPVEFVPTKAELAARAEAVGIKIDLRKPLQTLIAQVVDAEALAVTPAA